MNASPPTLPQCALRATSSFALVALLALAAWAAPARTQSQAEPQPASGSRTVYVPVVFGSGTPTQAPPPAGQRWSDPATWGGRLPQPGESVTIPAGQTVLLDINTPPLRGLQIDGTLVFDDRDLTLTADWIMVHGALRIGDPTRPYRNRATLTLTGSDTTESVMGMGTRGIMLMGGTLSLTGVAPSPAWTRLTDHADAGAARLTLAEATGWRAGDQVVIAPTDFYRVGGTERRELAAASGASVTLRQGITQFRWGRLQHVTASGMSLTPDPSFTPPASGAPTILDQRAAVGNLSRNIVIQGADDARWRADGFGAHIMAMAGSTIQMDGVELRNVGQAGRSGRYPIHFHLLSYDPSTGAALADVSGTYVRNSSVWASQNRCIVVHGTNGVRLQNNICYDIRGHAIFLEDAVERRNLIERNLVLRVRNPEPSRRLQVHDGPVFQGGSSGFWLTNPDNVVRGNLAADAEGNGFWLSFPERTLGALKNVPIRPFNIPLGVFEDNIAHSNKEVGVNLDWVPFNDAGEVRPFKYTPWPNGTDTGNAGDRLRFTLARVTTFKNEGGGFWNRVSLPDYVGWVSADNVGTFFAGAGDSGRVTGSLIVGTSLNNRTPYPGSEPPVALASYHSTFDIDRNVIVNFPFVPGRPSGAFKTDDYYIRAVDKGLVRNPDNRLIQSSPGYRVPPVLAENWTLAGALWDPHGYWGPPGNYWVYDQPFLTHGANCQPVPPAGQNGASCDGEYYGVGMFMTDYQRDRYGPRIPIAVTRQDSAGSPVGQWTVGDGNLAPKLGNMRHFAARTGGRYVLRFPDRPVPTEVALSVENLYRPGDWFVLAVPFDGASAPRAYLTSWYHFEEPAAWPANHFQIQHRRDIPAVGSLQAVIDSPGVAMWQDSAADLVWVKVRGGLPTQTGASDPFSDDSLYRALFLRVYR